MLRVLCSLLLFVVTPSALAADRGEPIELFDGQTLEGWTDGGGKPVTQGWKVEDGVLFRDQRAGHIYYEQEFRDFELTFEWKIAKRGNSGVKYRLRRFGNKLLGCEFQLLDESEPKHSKGATGSLYALYEPNENKVIRPAGEWNTAKIVVLGNHIEHWLNGQKIVEAEIGSEAWDQRLRRSKFWPNADFATRRGKIMLQDHGSQVWFRKLVLVPLRSDEADALAKRERDRAKAARSVKQLVAHRGASQERPENTLAALERAMQVKATAAEVDVRMSRDGALVLLHDDSLDRTTDGAGPVSEWSLAELKRLDAGGWFHKRYQGEPIPTLREALAHCRGKIDLLLDLKESGEAYAKAVAAAVRESGDPKRTIIGVRSVEQAKRFRKWLPDSPQLGLIPSPEEIQPFAEAGVEMIRLWPQWLEKDETLVKRLRQHKMKLHINGDQGTAADVLPAIEFRPDSLSADDPRELRQTLDRLAELE